jgi:hypothetical protein
MGTVMKKFLLSIGVAGMLLATNGIADDAIKTEMNILNQQLLDINDGFIRGNKEVTIKALEAFEAEAHKQFDNVNNVKKLLPKDKQYKLRVAMSTTVMIQDDIQIIKENMDNVRRDIAQNTFLDLQRACMRCHNLVRDW